ncbi:MAG: hypothetical protein FD176_995 [Rhodospirillaceae bacterium]|nr:MAG: hypothetical protein FD176_995 [Rhodospirillaceae bacterium]TNC97742.1 MAG: Uncharacterized protein FD119_730 [Stygiobacter sp.]
MDDVIRIRIDATLAVADFLAQLAEQAAEGETAAPANPANRAIFRELAPFRLVEYSYIDPGIGSIDGVCVGFADGSLFSVSEDIPEAVVDALVAQGPADLPAIYIYILLAEPSPAAAIDHFLDALAVHLGRPLIGVFRDKGGCMAGHCYALDTPIAGRAALALQTSRSVLEANRHFDKARTLRLLARSNLTADGRAFAQITYKFSPHVAEFTDAARRDDFIAWSRTLCEWIYSRWCDWQDLGLTEILRPAEMAAGPSEGAVAVRLIAPADYDGGKPWQAFGGTDATSAVPFSQSDAALSGESLRRSLAVARQYWSYVTDTIAAGEAVARARADTRHRRGMKLE